ncbi:MAG: O-antigen ligase family protein [Verrucomicrobia bacterium]|nr:O-antigen ligase family protein [Verrucomicrobiota bacterium]
MTPPGAANHPLAPAPAGRHHHGAPSPLERIVLIHVGGLVVLSSWAFGGAAPWARSLIAGWGSLALLITLAAVWNREPRHPHFPSPLPWLWPVVIFNVLVLASCFNPSFALVSFGAEPLLAHTGPARPWLPSTAFPRATLEHLGLFDAIYLSAFNLTLTVRRRRTLRRLLLLALGNAVVLAVFGTFQRLVSSGLFFGLVPAPNPRFFATFVYGNHWGAYVVLMIAVGLGLIFYYARRHEGGEPGESPVIAAAVAVILMAITPALAGSRAGLILVTGLLGWAGLDTLVRVARRRRSHGESAALPVAALVAGAVLVVGSAVYLGREPLRERWQDTQGQLHSGLLRERLDIYRDTLRLARAEPTFGWGLASFERALQLIRPRPVEENRQYEHSYADAHSDWLQALAEVGLVGVVLLASAGLVPLYQSRVLQHAGSLVRYLLAGLALVLGYAAVEFPFANPAVATAFWVILFAAAHYVRLSLRADSR